MRARSALALAALSAAACGGETDPGPIGGAPARIVIVPGALLLTPGGASADLRVVGIEAGGDTVELADPVTWQSSHPGAVTVSEAGLAAPSAAGSATITARAGGLTSPPILALVARPTAGALLVADAQIAGAAAGSPVITPVDPDAPYQPGWQYRVRLLGVAPSVGQVVLGTGGAPVGGRVVSVSPSNDGAVDVVLELLPLSGMFEELEVNEAISLVNAETEVPDPALKRGARARASVGRPAASAGRRVEQEFSLGRFKCKVELPPTFQFPASLDDAVELDVDPSLTLDMVFENAALRRYVVHGTVAVRLTANPLLTAGVEAKAECKATQKILTIPIGGPLALLFGGQVPLGAGFEIGAKASFGQLGFDAFYEASLTTEFGIDCTAACGVVAEMTTSPPAGFFKPVLPSFADDLRFELAGSVFGFAELAIGNKFLEELRFETVELKAGLEQKFELAGQTAQANDAAYASTFALKPVLEFKTSSKLQALAGLLGITLAEISFAPELPVISQSPRGAFTITPGAVAAGDGSALGETATFTVTLDPVDYFGVYAVRNVRLLRYRSDGSSVTLEPGRPGCTDVEATSGQTTFSCQTDFLETDAGPQTFFAFVETAIFGIPMPVPLEVAVDGKAVVQVSAGGEPPPPPPPGSCPAIRFPGFGVDADSVAKLTCVETLLVESGPVAFPLLTRVEDGLAVRGGAGVTFPVLSIIGGGAVFESAAETELDLSSLRQIEGGLSIRGMTAMVKLAIGGAAVTGGLQIVGNQALTDIDGVSCGLSITGGLTISDNTALSAAAAQAKADCITADTRTVENNGP